MIFNSVIVGSGGGGTGATVMAKALGDTYHYGEGAKVILTPTGILYSGTVSSAKNLTNANQADYTIQPNSLGPLTKTSFRFDSKWDRSGAGYVSLVTTYKEDLSGFTATLTSNSGGGDSYYYTLADYRDDAAIIGLQMNVSNDWAPNYKGMGVVDRDNGSYTQVVGAGSGSAFRPGGAIISYAGKHASTWYGGAMYYDDSYNGYAWNWDGTSYAIIPSYFNGSWYGIRSSSVYPWGSSTSAYSFTSSTYNMGISHPVIPLDDEWTYLFWLNNNSGRYEIVRVNKSTSSAWTLTSLSQPNTLISSVDLGSNGTVFRPGIKCKDYGDYVEIFYMAVYAKAAGAETPTSEVAHFKFYKATETLERLPDVFTGIGADWDNTYTTFSMGIQVNWQEKLIALVTSTRTSTSPYNYFFVYITKYDGTVGVYKYCAYPRDRQYYYNSSITGIVKENKGVNPLGDWILEVETVEDPDYIFDNSGILYGMEVTVNPGI